MLSVAKKRAACLLAVALLALTGFSHSADAALVAYSDYAAFVAAATGVQQIETFEGQTAGTALTSIGDISFASDGGETLFVYDTFPTFTISPTNYIGDDFDFEPLDEVQVISISFGAARSAAGLWVQYDSASIANDGVLELIELNDANGTVAAVAPGSGVAVDGDQAFFIGLVDSAGLETITELELYENGTGFISYTFDNVVSYQVVAVPEPSTLMAFAVVGGGFLARRRRS
ncbi:PEP-CTERM sorting domain-containing protein [Rubripirellula reticaptiva]|uniref:Ice-binding protein C-terminal domain-containing protein n=1 Tax=Rubripirellula reticaptiva TaxID=2528013 RepID=A0A5C6EUT0_9BACT|nr:PEP-CTERM sorting domain-containing protein [Rubripirellula reticaptiva]TWU51209.1 hypothetical protein Poly59_28000 [Rubripirellula reticaptiva]